MKMPRRSVSAKPAPLERDIALAEEGNRTGPRRMRHRLMLHPFKTCIHLAGGGRDVVRSWSDSRSRKMLLFPMVFGVFPDFQNEFPLYLSLRKGLTHRLRLLGIEKHAKRLSAPWECRSKLTAGRPENVKCFGRFGTNAALCQIEGPRFRQRPCAVPFCGKRDVPFDRRRRSGSC